MDVPGRNFPVPRPDERQVLTQWLDFQRATVRPKCEGLSDYAAHQSLIATSPATTVADLVAHLIGVERHWMIRSFLGEPIEHGSDWGQPGDSLAQLLDEYDAQCDRSREIAAAHDLDTPERYAPEGLPIVSLRWILGHLVQETARHLGHLDILRELLDGRRGY